MEKILLFFLLISLALTSFDARTKEKKVSNLDDPLPATFTMEDLKKVRHLTKVEEAAMQNNLPEIKRLLKKGEKLYPPDNKIGSPLFYAVFYDNLEMVNFLIKEGADVNFKMANGMTPLALAIMRNQVTLSDVLIDSGANVNEEVSGTKLIEMAQNFNYGYLVNLLKNRGAKERASKGTKKKP